MRALLLLPLLAVPAAAFDSFELANGMKVLLAVDRKAPVVTVAWAVGVGARQEPRGRTGFAHLFEHLMFQGSAHVRRGEWDKVLEGLGAENNASTHVDQTMYYETVPAHALETALWLDADRLAAPAVTEKGLRNQIDVVKEEKRQSVDNEPYAPLLTVEVASRSFANFANAHDAYGRFADLEAARLADVKAFFDAHYAPREVRMALVGDFDPDAARALVERYFASIPNRSAPAAPVPTDEPARAAGLSVSLRDEHAAVPGLALVWRADAPRASRERWALALVGRYLCSGDAGRLRQALVKEAQAASAVDEPYEGGLGFPTADVDDYKEPGLFGFFLLRRPEVSTARLKELALAEVAKVAAEGVPPEALARVKARLAGDRARARQTTRGRALEFVRSWVLDGTPAAADAELETAMTVSADETKAAAARWLAAASVDAYELEAGKP